MSGIPFRPERETSIEAAEVLDATVDALERVVLEAIDEAGSHGLTDEETQRKTGLDGNTQRPRRVRLVEKGLVFDSGKKRLTRRGRRAAVWVTDPQYVLPLDHPSRKRRLND